MPHDKNGQPLEAGDKVAVECIIESICEGDYCTTNLKTVEVMPGNKEPSSITVNAKQVVKIASKPETVEEAARRGYNGGKG